jgi:hypothetical protein
MKVLCSQEVVSPHLCGVVPCQVTAQVSAPQGPWCVRCVWLQQGVRNDLAWSKPTDFEALSRGSFRKKARNLIETAQRKSQRLALHAPLAYYRLQKFLTGVRAPLAHTTAAIFLLRASRGAFLVSMLGKGGEAHRGIARGMR